MWVIRIIGMKIWSHMQILNIGFILCIKPRQVLWDEPRHLCKFTYLCIKGQILPSNVFALILFWTRWPFTSVSVFSLHVGFSLACVPFSHFMSLLSRVCPDHLIMSAMSVNPHDDEGVCQNSTSMCLQYLPSARGYFCGKDWWSQWFWMILACSGNSLWPSKGSEVTDPCVFWLSVLSSSWGTLFLMMHPFDLSERCHRPNHPPPQRAPSPLAGDTRTPCLPFQMRTGRPTDKVQGWDLL